MEGKTVNVPSKVQWSLERSENTLHSQFLTCFIQSSYSSPVTNVTFLKAIYIYIYIYIYFE
ncbi:MAG: hypothetical protein ACRCVL_05755, partial [Cetobacterium sp.]